MTNSTNSAKGVEHKFPPLPDPIGYDSPGETLAEMATYSGDQMREYALAAIRGAVPAAAGARLTDKLPPLPRARMLAGKDLDNLQVFYTPEQMREYALLSRSNAAQPMTDEHRQLCIFYDVETLADLVSAQAKHIEKLQSKLPKTPDQFPGTYRRA